MERYAVGAIEQKINKLWEGKSFPLRADDLKSALLMDIKERFNGTNPTPSAAPVFTSAGILVAAPFNADDEALCRTYGGDAFRLALLCERDVNSDTILPYWRFINKAWEKLKIMTPAPVPDDAFLKTTDFILKADFYHAFTTLKSVMKFQKIPPAFPFFLYPFLPHLITAFFPDIPSRMDELKYETTPTVKVFKNGKYCGTVIFKNQTQEMILKEALSFDAFDVKIPQKVIYKKGRLLNVLV